MPHSRQHIVQASDGNGFKNMRARRKEANAHELLDSLGVGVSFEDGTWSFQSSKRWQADMACPLHWETTNSHDLIK